MASIVNPEKHTDKKHDFDKRLADARAKLGKNDDAADDADKGQSLSQGYRMGLEFVSAVAVGAFIGYWLDRWLDTAPIFLIALLLAGTVTGIRNLMRLFEPVDKTTSHKAPDDDQNDETSL